MSYTELSVHIKSASCRRRSILHDVDFTLASGSFTALIGRNGSGKSTLLSCIAGLIPFAGTVLADHTDLAALSPRERARRIGIMHQQPHTPHVPVEDLIAFGRAPYHPFGIGNHSQEDLEKIESALRATSTECFRSRLADTLSGGEQRQVHFAALLAQDTPIVLLDESTAFLDTENERRYLEIAASLKKKKTVLAVLHDLSSAVLHFDRILLLDSGTVVFHGTTDEFLATTLAEEYFRVKRYAIPDENGDTTFFFR